MNNFLLFNKTFKNLNVFHNFKKLKDTHKFKNF